MPFFRRGGDDDRARRAGADADRVASLAALERGELPTVAARRVQEIAERGGFYTSDLSINEFVLLDQIGVRPLAQVMGSSIYHVGWQQTPVLWGGWQPTGVSQELTVLSDAWNAARVRAFARLEQEAHLLGADAVVGVQLRTGRHDWAAGAIEYVAVGTAVKVDATPAETPTLTDLSGQDYWQLVQAGFQPVGVLGASTVYYVTSGWQQQQAQSGMFSSWANQELSDFTQGVYDAREAALGRITAEALTQTVAGIVGVTMQYAIEEREIDQGGSRRTDLVVTMHVLGTSIRESTASDGGTAGAPRIAIDLTRNRDQVHILGGSR